jgi:hypothetical protein
VLSPVLLLVMLWLCCRMVVLPPPHQALGAARRPLSCCWRMMKTWRVSPGGGEDWGMGWVGGGKALPGWHRACIMHLFCWVVPVQHASCRDHRFNLHPCTTGSVLFGILKGLNPRATGPHRCHPVVSLPYMQHAVSRLLAAAPLWLLADLLCAALAATVCMLAAAPAQPVLPAAPGVNGGPLAVFMQQPVQQQQQQPVQQPPPPAQPLSGLQALLGNPAMLSAAILGGAAGSSTGSGGDTSGGSMFGGFQQLPGTFSAVLGGGGQSDAGFADEGDDPYDPTLEG